MSMYTWDKEKKKRAVYNWFNSPEVRAYRTFLFNKQRGVCPLCHKQMIVAPKNDVRNLTKDERYLVASLDHIVPLSEGGAPLDFGNLRLICALCNSSRSVTNSNSKEIT